MKIKQIGGVLFCFILCLFLSGCATTKNYQTNTSSTSSGTPSPTIPGSQKPYQVYGEWYQPMADASGFSEEGLASWYGEQFHGKKTSSGDIYDMHGLTAAHKTLPFGTTIQVTNMLNGKTICVVVNDRGPFLKGRILDLSYGAARQLEFVGQGVVPVKIITLSTEPESSPPGGIAPIQNTTDFTKGVYSFQVGAFSSKEKAEKLREQLAQTHADVYISPKETSNDTLYRVRVGRCTDLAQIVQQELALKKDGFVQIYLVTE